MERQIEFDCVVCGITTVDLILGPAILDEPLEKGALHYIDQVQAIVGGITSNSGTALARLGMRTAVLGYLGNDIWAEIIRERLSLTWLQLFSFSDVRQIEKIRL